MHISQLNTISHIQKESENIKVNKMSSSIDQLPVRQQDKNEGHDDVYDSPVVFGDCDDSVNLDDSQSSICSAMTLRTEASISSSLGQSVSKMFALYVSGSALDATKIRVSWEVNQPSLEGNLKWKFLVVVNEIIKNTQRSFLTSNNLPRTGISRKYESNALSLTIEGLKSGSKYTIGVYAFYKSCSIVLSGGIQGYLTHSGFFENISPYTPPKKKAVRKSSIKSSSKPDSESPKTESPKIESPKIEKLKPPKSNLSRIPVSAGTLGKKDYERSVEVGLDAMGVTRRTPAQLSPPVFSQNDQNLPKAPVKVKKHKTISPVAKSDYSSIENSAMISLDKTARMLKADDLEHKLLKQMGKVRTPTGLETVKEGEVLQREDGLSSDLQDPLSILGGYNRKMDGSGDSTDNVLSEYLSSNFNTTTLHTVLNEDEDVREFPTSRSEFETTNFSYIEKPREAAYNSRIDSATKILNVQITENSFVPLFLESDDFVQQVKEFVAHHKIRKIVQPGLITKAEELINHPTDTSMLVDLIDLI
eukprot:GHVP01032366.1.p1 GENE.GHVP01032366.1~~GHVP01032366.1.p1  ORF type:complete len:602 (+),score=129.05 GHVP01032366.1:212-1807(+)